MASKRAGRRQRQTSSEWHYFERPTVAFNPLVFEFILKNRKDKRAINDLLVLAVLMIEAGERHSEHNIARISREAIALRVFGRESAKNHVSTSLKRWKAMGVVRQLEEGVYQLNLELVWSGNPSTCFKAESGQDDQYKLPFEITPPKVERRKEDE